VSRELRRSAPTIGLILAIVAYVVLNLWARHDSYFFYDEYEIVLHRHGLHDLLEPTNGHPVIMWLPIFYLLRSAFGLDSALPYEVVGILAMSATAGILFGYLRQRSDPWVGLIGAVLILFLGSGGDVLFWSFQLAFAGSVGCGVAALWALERGDRHREFVAALLLIASVFFLAVGLAFVAAAATVVVVRRWPPALRRTLADLCRVVGPPLFLYVVWYLAYGHDSPSRLSLDNLLATPSFIVDGAGASLAFLVGLAGSPTTRAATEWGLPLLAGLVALAVWRLRSRPPVAREIWIGAVGALAFWFLTAVNKPIAGIPEAGRYCFVGAVFALLVIAELLRGTRWTRGLAVLALAMVAFSVVGNLAGVRYGRTTLSAEARVLKANLAALDIAAEDVEPTFALTPEVSGSSYEIVVDAGSYLASTRAYGTPALSEAELLEAEEPLRANADSVLRAALPVELAATESVPGGLSCTEAKAGTAAATAAVPSGLIWLRAGSDGAELSIARFAEGGPPLGTIEAGGAARLSIPPDRSQVPWKLTVTQGATSVCGK
jgi:hypothetical protein